MIATKKTLPVQAFQLGRRSLLEEELLGNGMLLPQPDGLWRIKTREAPEEGELVATGDYVKLDSAGMPYPVERRWFEENHICGQEGLYLQKAEPKKTWNAGEPLLPEIQFLLERDLLIWKPEEETRAFSAWLWGTWQIAESDAVVVLDLVETDSAGNLRNVEFHFVAADEFKRSYRVL